MKTFLKVLAAVTFSIVFGTLSTYEFAYAASYSSKEDCYNQSNGRRHIPSVQWVCDTEWDSVKAGTNVCSAWLGSATDSKSLTITLDISGLSGTVSAKYYGMCTQFSNTTAVLRTTKDADSIDDSTNLTRGTWGSPGDGLKTTIDIAKFVGWHPVDGWPSTRQNGDYTEYTRRVNVYRCHGGNSGSCADQEQDITLKIKLPSTEFTGKVDLDSTNATYNSTTKKYYIDSDKVNVTFKDYVKRKDTNNNATVTNSWWAYRDKSSSSYASGTHNFATSTKDKWELVKTDTRNNISLSYGDNTICEEIEYYKKVSYAGNGSNKEKKDKCITVHRYYWASYDGRVVPVVADTDKNANKSASDADTVWVDSNSAALRFKHQLKRTNTVNAATWFKTSRSTGTTNYTGFNQQTSWANSTVTANSWKTEYNSNSSNINVDAARTDVAANISTYCQILYYYPRVREDRAAWDPYVSKTGCVKIRPYKTTFTGAIKIEVKINGTWTEYHNGDSIDIDGENIPTDVPVRFTHTVTRSSSDSHGSPNKKKTYIRTELGSTSGYRFSDDHGSIIAQTDSGDLAAGDKFSKTDSFTTKIYPEQTIKLCQKLYFKDRIWGSDPHEGSVGEYCITLTKKKVSCQGVEYGVKTAHNYLTMEIYKNSALKSTSGRLDESADKELTVWAKPGDSVRYKYTMCAAGELASQFADKYITTYSIGTDKAGYLFGKTLSSSPYTATSKVVGTSSSTPGEGPFPNGTTESHKYEYTTNSPSNNADDLYKCGDSGISDYYNIPGIRPNDPNFNTLKDNCASAKVGETSDVGKSFTQTAYWTDIWYENGVAQDGHRGDKTATVTGRVNVPYNYVTEVSTGASGGNVVLGQSVKAKVSLKIGKRQNELVNGTTAYTTYSKPTKYRLVQITVAPGSDLSAATYRDEIAAQEYGIMDNDGSQDTLLSALSRCSRFSDWNVNCSIVRGRDTGTTYYPGDNTAHNIGGSNITVSINDDGSNFAVGTKICFVAAIWPSDSHGIVDTNITKDHNQAEALRDTGSRWHLSKLSCFTVAKRPSMASLGSDIYAPAGIIGVTSKRSTDRADNKALFGSWSEYGLVSGTIKNTSAGEIKGVASGASLWGGGTMSNVTRTCYFSSMTFANAECADEKLGQVPINTASSSYPERLAEQIRTRYTDSNNNAAKTSATKIGVGGVCTYDPNSNTYVASGTNSESKFICLPNGAKYTHATANLAYIDDGVEYCMVKGDTYNSRTSVIEADKTLIIGTNMAYGNIYNTEYAGTVSNTGCYKQSYNTISEIPQLIIIADKIVIKQNVKHIDAWLIANEIYTCDPRSGYNAINQNNNKLDKNTINAANCNNQLTITGPVITQKLNLFRTGGGDSYANNGMPAEIFYLGPESYLWAYNQAQRFSQATTTYQRELPPRY